MAFKPDGYNSVSPYLVVRDAKAVIAFLEKTFGAAVTRKYEGPNGKLHHGEVRLDDTVVMLADETDQYRASPAQLHVYVPNVDETFAKALAAGGKEVQKPVKKGDPDKRGGVADPSGNTWWISTQTEG